MALASCFRPACAVAVRLAAVSPSAGVVAFRLGRGAGWGGFRARWPSLRRRPGRLGRWPRSVLRPLGGLSSGFAPRFAPAARLRALSLAAVPAFGWRWGGALRSVSRGRVPLPPPRPRGAPPFPPSCSPSGRTRPEILAGAGGRALVPCSRWSQSVARGARALASPLSRRSSSRRWRARSACRAVCSFRALRRASPPSSGWPGAVVKDVSSSSVRAWGTGTRLPALRSPPIGGDSAQTARKSQGGEVSPASVHKILCTKNPRPEKYWQGTAGNGSRPQNRGKAQKSPEMPSKCARPDQRRAKRGIPNPKRPADWPEMGYQMSSRCLSVR